MWRSLRIIIIHKANFLKPVDTIYMFTSLSDIKSDKLRKGRVNFILKKCLSFLLVYLAVANV